MHTNWRNNYLKLNEYCVMHQTEWVSHYDSYYCEYNQMKPSNLKGMLKSALFIQLASIGAIIVSPIIVVINAVALPIFLGATLANHDILEAKSICKIFGKAYLFQAGIVFCCAAKIIAPWYSLDQAFNN